MMNILGNEQVSRNAASIMHAVDYENGNMGLCTILSHMNKYAVGGWGGGHSGRCDDGG